MEYRTWEIPAERQRSRGEQTLDDLRFTLVLFWRYLTGPFVAPPSPLTAGAAAGKLPVVIIPGFICRPAIYLRLQAALHAAGVPCYIRDLGYHVSSVHRKAQQVSRVIDEIGAKQVYAIGHSMGGLILATSLYLGETRVRHGWTLGAPLMGTNIVYVVYALVLLGVLGQVGSGLGLGLVLAVVFLSAGLRQMVPGSDLLRFVSRRYDEMQNLTSVFCAMDTIVFANPLNEPGSSSRFGRPTDVLFPEAGHNNIAMGDNAIRAIVDAVEAQQKGSE
jgi:pimeloyl-ACP methyl ester carboxylesterase